MEILLSRAMRPIAFSQDNNLLYDICLLLCKAYAITSEPLHDTTNKMTSAPSKDSSHSGHPSSLVRVFTKRSKGTCS